MDCWIYCNSIIFLNFLMYQQQCMQNPRRKASFILFDFILNQQELSQLIHANEAILKKLIQQSSKRFTKFLTHNRKRAYIFLANYKLIMELHSKEIRNVMSINISLHFALLFTHDLLSENQYAYAKDILKQTEQYLQFEDCDLILLASCMNNLAQLHLRSARPKKALASCLNGIGLMEGHLQSLHLAKNRNRITEDGVIFVNLLLIAKRSLIRIIKSQTGNIQLYRQLHRIINKTGYNFSSKYLGISSVFTAKFETKPDSIDLPIYDESLISEEPLKSDFQARLTEQLSSIYQILKDMKHEPEVYYIKKHLVEQKQSHKSQIIPFMEEVVIDKPSVEVSVEPQKNEEYIEHVIVNEWDIQVSITITKNLLVQKQFDFMGSLQFRLTKGRKLRQKFLSEEQLYKILHLINTYDILPYEMELKRFTCAQFTKRLLLCFMEVTTEGDVMILPRAKPVIPPFHYTFCGEKALVMVNHVRFRRFRVAICPIDSCETLYLQVEFKHKQTDLFFSLVQFQNQTIAECSKRHHPQQKFIQQYNYAQIKKVQILGPIFETIINRILRQFETFLTEQEEYRMSQMTTVVNFTENYLYYKYTQFKEAIGQFHLVKYRSNSNHIELSCKNIFPTFTPNGQDFARGTTTYSPQQFLRDFAVPMKASKRYMPVFCELILQKFNLKIYAGQLLEQDQDLYEQNAISEVPITSKCYTRRFLPFEDYLLPITIEIVTVNNEKPIGIRVTAYEPLKGTHSGLFIHVTPEYWERPSAKQQPGNAKTCAEDPANGRVKRSTEDYNFKKCYFLTTWMEQEGFRLIFDKLEVVNRALEIRGVNSKYVSLDKLFRPLHE